MMNLVMQASGRRLLQVSMADPNPRISRAPNLSKPGHHVQAIKHLTLYCKTPLTQKFATLGAQETNVQLPSHSAKGNRLLEVEEKKYIPQKN